MKTVKKTKAKARAADGITAGMRELEEMMATGKSHGEMQFTVKMIEVPLPAAYKPKDVLQLREKLGVSQALFAQLVGVSTILVQSWEGGKRMPSPVARRLLDTIRADPAAWLATVRASAAA